MKYVKRQAMTALLTASFTLTALAEMTSREVNDFINQMVQKEEQVRGQAGVASPVERLTAPSINAQSQSFIDQLKNRRPNVIGGAEGTGKPQPDAYYFVSFSIPQEGLKRMIAEADTFFIPATVRGLVNNNMNDTVAAVLELVDESGRGGVQIDPEPFGQFGIESVPVLVVTCADGKFDRIAGNLRLREALERIAEKGECGETARRLLAGAKS